MINERKLNKFRQRFVSRKAKLQQDIRDARASVPELPPNPTPEQIEQRREARHQATLAVGIARAEQARLELIKDVLRVLIEVINDPDE